MDAPKSTIRFGWQDQGPGCQDRGPRSTCGHTHSALWVIARGPSSFATNYSLGARGVDAISTTTSSGTTVAYPIYDAHGNMISTLSKSGTNAYTFTAVRTFDASGVIRRGAASGDPKGRYCASLGHKQDDESGLIYMRARYYEPGSGRFVTEDPSHKGSNWVIYALDNPITFVDSSGSEPWDAVSALGGVILCFLSYVALNSLNPGPSLVANLFISLLASGFSGLNEYVDTVALNLIKDTMVRWQSLLEAQTTLEYADQTLAGPAVQAEVSRSGAILAELLLQDCEAVDLGGFGFSNVVY